MEKTNSPKYDEMLEKYLSEGINYDANTISKAKRGDLEQLAADSYWKGWQDCKSLEREQKESEEQSNCDKPAVSVVQEPIVVGAVCPHFQECLNGGKNQYCDLQTLKELDCFVGQTER